MSTKWLSPAEAAAWMQFIPAAEPLLAALDTDLHSHGLTLGEYEVLANLSDADEHRLRMTDLAERLRLSPSGLTRRLDGLVRRGHVSRASCASDRRVMYAVLTPQGYEFLKAVAPEHVASVRRHFIDGLDAGELATIATVFGRIRAELRGAATVPA